MDLVKAIRELYEEKKRLDTVIASLESMIALEGKVPGRQPAPKKRGRKSMSREERQEVSARMKKYWAERRQKTSRGGEQSGLKESTGEAASQSSSA